MGAIAQLSSSTLDVEPGRSATMAVTVRNSGTVVDRFTFEAVGDAAGWVTFAPDTLSLFPEASGTVNVMFAPPRSHTVTAGAMPFGVRVVSSEDSAGSVVEEGTLNVAPFSDITVELVPRVTRGSRTGRTELAVDNRSNTPYRAELIGADPEAALGILFNHSVVDVPPGGAEFVKVKVRPKQTFWRGPTRTKPFRITLKNQPAGIPAPADAATGGGEVSSGASAAGAGGSSSATAVMAPPASPHKDEIFADGSMMQEALLPPWVKWLLAALIGLAAIFALLWFVLFRPEIRSTAKGEVNKQLAAAGVASTGSTGASSGGGAAGSGSGGGGGGGSTTATTLKTSGGGTVSLAAAGGNIDGSYTASGNGAHAVYKVPNGDVLRITDLLVENSAGDTGTLQLARNGTVLMSWSMANFRDLDYHWITPTVFGGGSQLQIIVSGCTGACTPGVYYSGDLVKASG